MGELPVILIGVGDDLAADLIQLRAIYGANETEVIVATPFKRTIMQLSEMEKIGAARVEEFVNTEGLPYDAAKDPVVKRDPNFRKPARRDYRRKPQKRGKWTSNSTPKKKKRK